MTARTPNQVRLAQWLALPSISHDGLARLGIDRQIANRAGGLAWSRITTFGRGFDFSPSGIPAVIQPVWRGPAPSLECGVENPVLDDMIAWRQSWCEETGEYLCNMKRFAQNLQAHDYTRTRIGGSGRKGFSGLAPRSEQW